MRSHVRDIVENYLGPQKAEEFARWAFGPSFETILINTEGWKYWNDLHSEDLELKPEGILKEDIPKMIEIWKEKE